MTGISLSTPFPVSAESWTMGTPLICGSRRSSSSFSTRRTSCGLSTVSHLLTPMIRPRPSCSTRSAIWRSCRSKGCVASSSTTTTSAKRMARSVSATESFSSFSVTRARRRIPAVSHSLTRRTRHSHSMPILSRVMPASGPVSMRSSPRSWFTRVDLPTFGRPTKAMRSGASRSGS